MKISKFQNEVQEFWHRLINSDTVKFFISAATKIVDAIGKVTGSLGELGTATAVITSALSIKSLLNGGGGRAKYTCPHNINMPPNRLAVRCASLVCIGMTICRLY